jgi:hypothetical protein
MKNKDPLIDEPFDFRETRDGLALISFRGKLVTTLAGKEATRFLNKAHGASPGEQQLLMAKATGHFKHGNERSGKLAAKKP